MKPFSRALAALPCLTLTAALAAGVPMVLKPHTELVLTPAGGPASVQVHQGRITLASATTLTVTPDPFGESLSRQWALPAGTELNLSLAPGQALRRLDLARSVDLEVGEASIAPDPGQGTKYPPTFAPNTKTLAAPEAPSLSIDPDPGSGEKYPPG